MVRTLTKEEVIRVIEGKGNAQRVPIFYDYFIQGYMTPDDPVGQEMTASPYPRDIQYIRYRMPGLTEGYPEDPDYCWAPPGKQLELTGGYDNRIVIDDWENDAELEAFYRTFPTAQTPDLLPEKPVQDDRYVLGHYWWTYFERLWQLRGMENALTDFYDYPEQVHKLFGKLTELYIGYMERGKKELDFDGFLITDDLGAQDRPMFSTAVFREFFKPYYKQIIDKAHELGCHLWLHSCGCIEPFLPELVEIGLDVIHPIQKNTMDERKIARLYGGQICILAGIDVQYLFSFGTPQEIADEVAYLMDTYTRPDGRFMITLGNGYTPDWKTENLHALYQSTLRLCEERKEAFGQSS